MADNATCFALIKGAALRVTKVDSCGKPVPGAKSTVVTKGFITVSFTANNTTANTIDVQNADGDTCIHFEPAPEFQGYTVEIQLCGVDPELVKLLTGQKATVNDAATPLSDGFKVNSNVDLSQVAFALELWSRVPGNQCAGGVPAYGYLLVPFLRGGTLGDFSVGNDAVNFTVSGALSQDGNQWGVGPYNILKTQAGAASPLLTALDAYDHLLVKKVTLAPPTTGACGSIPLGTVATTITAGIPATTTPVNSYAPDTLAGLTGITASPNTAWTTGQYVQLGDGSTAHWSGTAWVAGPA